MTRTLQARGRNALSAALCGATAILAVPNAALAEITRIDITSRAPNFEGRSFGSAGAYEKLRGKAYGEIDPADPKNAVITDIALAPRNARGKVEYALDFLILKPIDLARGNGKLFMEINNRGGLLYGGFNGSGGGNNPSTAADAGNAFLMNQGYSLAWSGWDAGAAPGADRLTITVPVASQPDGSAITGPNYEYIVADNATTQSYTLSYPAASLDTQAATLTVRDRLNDTPVPVPPSDWTYTDERTIRLLPLGTPLKQSAIYEFSYTAKNPVVAGIGFAATRDFVSFLRSAQVDSVGTANPLAGHAKTTYAFTVSQPARFVNDFVWLGFNQDEAGRKVFDGVLNWIGAGTGVAANVRFAQTARTERNRQNHLYPEAFFPFAYDTLFDPVSGKTDGRAVRCEHTRTCPKILQVNSSNEYWVKAGSQLHTDLDGSSLPQRRDMRYYLLASTEHTVSGSPANSPGICAQPRNVIDPNPALRGLFVALDRWVSYRDAPPRSAVPRQEDQNVAFVRPTANGVGVVEQADLGWPTIPGVLYSGLATARNQLDWGPLFDAQGVMSVNPPVPTGATYRHFVSKVDQDGNEVAGIRLPPVAVPTATYTGWAHRAAAFGGPDGCEASGQTLNFAATRGERLASGDPRRSLEERYRTKDRYVQAVERAASQLVRQRILLPDDAARYVEAARASTIPLP
jgi:Alpha/beta hydrolase domain